MIIFRVLDSPTNFDYAIVHPDGTVEHEPTLKRMRRRGGDGPVEPISRDDFDQLVAKTGGAMYPNKPEEFLGQIRAGDKGAWTDYARGHEEESRTWQAADPTNRRVVDWISREVIVPAECDAFNIRKEGVCGTPLTALDDCAYAYDHREV